MKFLRDVKVILSIVLVLVICASAVTIFMLKKQSNDVVALKDEEISELQSQLGGIGEMVSAYSLASDVVVGKTVEANDLVAIEIPAAIAGNIITDIDAFKSELIGDAPTKSLIYKLDLPAGAVLSKEMICDYELTDDLRYYDLVLNQYYVGMQTGDYFDVRYIAPSGEDSIVISQAKIEQVNYGIPKVILSEEDILNYRSAICETAYAGGYLYALQYVEAGLQSKAQTFYQAKPYLVSLMLDTSLEDSIKSQMAATAGVGIYSDDASEQERLVEQIKAKFQENASAIEAAQSEWTSEQQRIAEEEAYSAMYGE